MIDELKTSRVDEETLETLRIRVASLESLIRDNLEEEEADEEEGEGEDKEDDEDSLRDKLAELQRQILMLKEDQSSFGGWQESLSDRLEALAELWSSRQDSLTGRVVLLEERSEETREEVTGNGERLREAELMIDMLKRAGETKSKLLFSLIDAFSMYSTVRQKDVFIAAEAAEEAPDGDLSDGGGGLLSNEVSELRRKLDSLMSDLTTFTAELAEGVAGAQATADAVGETQREQGEQVRRKYHVTDGNTLETSIDFSGVAVGGQGDVPDGPGGGERGAAGGGAGGTEGSQASVGEFGQGSEGRSKKERGAGWEHWR